MDNVIIQKYLANQDKYVFPFEIKEKQKIRKIITYNNDNNYGLRLRNIHEAIRDEFEENFCERNKNSFAYHKGIRCLDALDDHLKSNHFIKLDIHHFFESITLDLFLKIYGNRFNKKWKEILAGCFYNGSLSIGFVTSPLLSDFFMSNFDNDIEEYIKDNPKLHYSRYSDDMLLSSEDSIESLDKLFEFVKTKIEEMGLELNEKKLNKASLSFEKRNSISFLGLNISKIDNINNKVTISKSYILFLLFLIEKNARYNGKCRELVNEINSRVAYLYYNSLISYKRFQKKYKNIYGVEYEFIPHKPNDRNKPVKASNIEDFEKYNGIFTFNIHAKVTNTNNAQVISSDCIEIDKYIGSDNCDIEIPPFVESIGKNVFIKHKFKNVILPKSLRSISDNAFKDTSIEEIILPDNISFIGSSAFENAKINEIKIPTKVTIISSRTFANSTLKKIELGNVKIIRDSAFSGCKKLEEVILPETITKLENSTFSNCTSLKSVNVLGNLYDLPNNTFENDYFLSNVKLNESLLTIGSCAFKSCLGLKEIYIPKNVVNIEYDAFANCKNLSCFNIDKDNRVYDSRDDSHALIEKNTEKLVMLTDKCVIPTSIKIIGRSCFSGRLIKNIKLPDGLIKIEDNAFDGCRLLSEIDIPDSVTYIGSGAFNECISLTRVHLSNNIEDIKTNTFNNCINLKSTNLHDNIKQIGKNAFNNNRSLDVKLPNNLINIGYKAFAKCYSIKELYIPKSVKNIADFAFACLAKSLDSIKVDNDNAIYADYDSNAIFDKRKRTLLLGCKNSIIPEGIEIVGEAAFIYCHDLKKIDFPKSVKLISKNAFRECISLKELNTNNVYEILPYAFYDCYELEKLTLNDTLVKLSNNAFSNCKKLNSVKLPNSINKYGISIFSNCTNLKSITFPSNYLSYNNSIIDGCNNIEEIIIDEKNPRYTSMNANIIVRKNDSLLIKGCKNSIIPDGIKSIGERAFENVGGLKTIKLPDSIERIETASFLFCDNLEAINLPDSIKHLGGSAFYGCKSLKEVVIPNGIKKIPNSLFNGCKKLEAVKLPDSSIYIDSNAFNNCESLSNIDLKNIIRYGKSAFENCYKLKPNLSNNIEVIDNCAFANNPNIINIKFNEKLNSFSNMAFYNCNNLSSIDIVNNEIENRNGALIYNDTLLLALGNTIIPDGIKVIAKGAFYNNKKIESVKLPDSLIRIEDNAFENSSVEKIEFNESLEFIGYEAFNGCANLKEVILPNLKELGAHAFANCNNIKKIFINNIKIGNPALAFYNSLNSLEEIKIQNNENYSSYDSNIIVDNRNNSLVLGCKNSKLNNNIKSISCDAFYGSKINKIDIPNSVISIDRYAFRNCKDLKELHFGSSVLKCSDAFSNTYSLNKISVDDNNLVYKVIDGQLINNNTKALLLATNDNIPDIIENISYNAFDGVKNIKELKIGANIKSFGNLSNCDIDNISVSNDNPYYIGTNNTLINKYRKTILVASNNTIIPDDVISIQNNSFSSAKKLKKLYIPKNVSYIDINSFYDIDLDEVVVDKNNPIFDSRNNSNAIITSKTNYLIYKCKNSIIPNDVNTFIPFDKNITNVNDYKVIIDGSGPIDLNISIDEEATLIDLDDLPF